MPYRACLIDVFDTVLKVDFQQHNAVLARDAGVDPHMFTSALAADWLNLLMDGRASIEEALAVVLHDLGSPIDEVGFARLVETDRQLLFDLHVLYDDARPFLDSLRTVGVRTAFVSNCSSNARPLLIGTGLADLVDHMVLSCEVGAAKPEPRIFNIALESLRVAPGDTVFVDDQRSYCAGATAVGIRSVRIDRSSGSGDIAALTELAAWFL